MNYTELRKEPRINVALLPEKYKEFEVLLAHGVTSIVKTAELVVAVLGFTKICCNTLRLELYKELHHTTMKLFFYAK